MTRRALTLLAMVACALAGASACGSSSKPAQPAAPADMRGQAAVQVDAVNNRFAPASIIVDAGTKVTWTNKDAVAHNVKKSADSLDFGAPFGVDVEAFGPNATYSFTFTKAGNYPYTCTIHSLMDGRVQVVEKGSGATTTTATGGPATGSTSSTTG